MTTTTTTTAHTVADVPGILSTGTYANGRTRQSWTSKGRPYPSYGEGALISAVVRFDNELGNARSSFSVTASLGGRVRADDRGSIGCAHDDIAAAFPELAHLIRWHLSDTAGPWGYEANAVYHAGDRDHNGKRAGEPWGWHDAVRFGDVPALHRIGAPLEAFLREIAGYDPEGQAAALVPVAVAGPTRDYGSGARTFSPKYQFAGEPVRTWSSCAFDTEAEAEAFGASVIRNGFTMERIPHLFSDGKARDLDAARRAAVWPDATDAELCAEPDALREVLRARLPGILEAFRADIAAAGLAWPEGTAWGERG